MTNQMTPAAARKKLAELVASFGGLEATSRAMAVAGTPIRADSLKRLLRQESGREIRHQLLDQLEAIADDKPRWLLARNGQEKWVIHLHAPAFAARSMNGLITSVQWFGSKPAARTHGDLIRQAQEFLDSA